MRVLLIEREAADAEPLRQALHAVAPIEFEVTVADSLPAALDLTRDAAFDVALLGLPSPSGPEAVRQLLEAAPDLPVVALVGPEDEALGEQAVAIGARDFLVKHSKRRTLAARVLRKATEIARLERERTALRHALADTRSRLGAVLHAGSVGVAFTSLDGRFEDVNFAFEAMLGFSHSELMGTSIWGLLALEGREDDRARIADLIEGRAKYYDLERGFLRRDGKIAIAITTISLTRDLELHPLQLAFTLRDVTVRRRTEEALRRSLEESRSILETANDAFITMNADGTIHEWNRRAERMFGWTRAEAIGRIVAETIVPPRLRDTYFSVLERLRRTGRSRMLGQPVEMMALRRDGSEFPAELTIWPTGSGEEARFNAFVRDHSEREQAHHALWGSELRFRALFDQSPMGIALQDVEGRIVASNPALQSMLGYDAKELMGRTYTDLAHSSDLDTAQDLKAGLLSGQRGSVQVERRYVRKDGQTTWLRVTASLVRDPEGQPQFFIAMCEEITDRKAAEAAMREMSLQLLDLIGAAASEASTDEEALRSAIQQVCKQVGWQVGHVVWAAEDGSGDAVPSNLWYLAEAGNFEEFQRASMATRFARGEGLPGRVLASGKPFWTSDLERGPLGLHGAVAAQAGLRAAFGFPVLVGEEIKAVMEFFSTEPAEPDATLMDAMVQIGLKLGRVIERKRLEALLEHQALHDSLTGLPNRALFLDRLRHALTRLDRNTERLALLFIDLDDFKSVNDTFGHSAGDRVLASIASRLRALLRPGDTVTRHGGDEFTILCEDIESEEQATVVGQRVLETLARPIGIDGAPVSVTASIGIAVAASARERPEALLANADAAMYRAKERGGARVEQFDATFHTQALQRRGIKTALRRALDCGQLRVLYQPSVSLIDGRIRAVEALIRWEHPERGLLLPEEIIPPAEDTGLIVPIGMWVLEEACRQSMRWSTAHPGREAPHMSVNLSSRQLCQAELPASLADTLARTGMDPRRLCLEITESVLMNDTEAALRELEALRALGIDLGIDDFGTGYSSLNYLKRFPFGWLKIDRSFVRGLVESRQDAAIVEAVVRLAHALDLTVVAEGVESAGQIDALRRLGCDWAQGFYYARPQPAEEMERLIASGGSW